MKLSKSAIKEIEEGLNKGQLCEVTTTDGVITVYRCSGRQDINLSFPILVSPKEPAYLKLMRENDRVILFECRVPVGYWVLGIKGAEAEQQRGE